MALRSVASVFRSGLFNDRVAVVTGGATGIGRAIASELALLGSKVVIASRNEERLRATADSISAADGVAHPVEFVVCNIRKDDEVANLMETAVSRCGAIDFLVNNGGGQFPSPASAINRKGWNAVIDTNLTGTFTCCREAYTTWMADNGGVIVNIVADMWKGFPGMCHTGAARAGVDNMTKTLSVEWAASGVRVNSVAPGVIYSASALSNYDDPTLFQQYIPHIPAKRLGTPEEVSAAVLFLLSPAGGFITGETIRVDGGSSLFSQAWPIPPHTTSEPYGDLPEELTSKPQLEAARARKAAGKAASQARAADAAASAAESADGGAPRSKL